MASMLTADAYQKIRSPFPAPLHRQFHEFAHTFFIQHIEGIVLQDAPFIVQRQELVLRIFS